jgi:hypothetical protein
MFIGRLAAAETGSRHRVVAVTGMDGQPAETVARVTVAQTRGKDTPEVSHTLVWSVSDGW